MTPETRTGIIERLSKRHQETVFWVVTVLAIIIFTRFSSGWPPLVFGLIAGGVAGHFYARYQAKVFSAKDDELLLEEFEDLISEEKAKKQRNLVWGAVSVIAVLVLASTVPTKADHERELRPAANAWARSAKTTNLSEAFAKFLLQLGTTSITSDPDTSLIDAANWEYKKMFIVSIVVDTDSSHKEKFVSWGLLHQVYLNSSKFSHD